ncbi:MAG: COG3014 family protein [Thiohalomonadales bacterium]
MKTCLRSKITGPVRGLLCLLLVVLLQACASYSETFNPIERKLAKQDPAGALVLLEKEGFSTTDELLFLLNKAMLLRMQNNFEASNQSLEQAKAVVEAFSAISIREQATALFINDATRAYGGTPLDQVMLHIYETLNYLALNKLNEARVEILQIDLRLRKLMSNAPNSALSVDPFSRYLAGMVYEDLGEYSDAMIAYRKAMQAYQIHRDKLYPATIPEALKFDLLRSAKRVGLNKEFKQLSKQFNINIKQLPVIDPQQGEVVLLLHNGLAPIKQENNIGLVDPGSGIMMRITLPYYQDRPKSITHARLQTTDFSSTSEVVEQLDAINHATLKSFMPEITARALTRAVIKYQATGQGNEKNNIIGLLVNIVGVFTERADTRSWLTLPAEIQLARLRLAPGEHKLSISLMDNNNRVVRTVSLGKINIIAGKRRYISYHNIPPYSDRYY